MIKAPDQSNIQFRWQAIFWRLLVTLLLLLALADFGLTTFDRITSNPGTQVLPTLSQEADRAN